MTLSKEGVISKFYDLSKARNLFFELVKSLIGIFLYREVTMKFYKTRFQSEYTCHEAITYIFFPFLAIVLILVHLFYITIHFIKHPTIEKYRINHQPWPWEQNNKKLKRKLPGIIIRYLINIMVYTLTFLIILRHVTLKTKLEDIPGFGKFALYIFIGCFLEDFFVYWGHRIVHHPVIYRNIHKIHHEFANSFYEINLYSHWLDFLLTFAIPNLLLILVLNNSLHIVTFMLYQRQEHSKVTTLTVVMNFLSHYSSLYREATILNTITFITKWISATSRVFSVSGITSLKRSVHKRVLRTAK